MGLLPNWKNRDGFASGHRASAPWSPLSNLNQRWLYAAVFADKNVGCGVELVARSGLARPSWPPSLLDPPS